MDSSRIGLLGQGCVVMILAASAGCSSSSVPPGAGPADSSTPTPTLDAGPEPVVDGGGGPCTQTYPVSVGTLITATVNWPASAAVAKGSGAYYLWLLTTYSVAGGKITGTTATCGTTPAILTLSTSGASAEGVPMGQTGQVKPTYPPDSFANVPPTSITGTLGGTNIGSSFEIDPSVTLQGLKPTDPLSDPTMKWPTGYTQLTASDLTFADGTPYDGGAGHPGIRGVFDGTPPYYLGGTSLASGSPKADQFWTVNRVQLALYGTSSSCTETKGSAYVTLINNRVVGCEIADAGGPCTADQFGFLDENTTQYAPSAGTFQSIQLTASQTCSDVLSMLPMPAQ